MARNKGIHDALGGFLSFRLVEYESKDHYGVRREFYSACACEMHYASFWILIKTLANVKECL